MDGLNLPTGYYVFTTSATLVTHPNIGGRWRISVINIGPSTWLQALVASGMH